MAFSYKELELGPALLSEATSRAANLPIFENSHRAAAANLVGCIGEIAFEKLLEWAGIPFEARLDQTTEDYALRNGLTIDVKTKDRTVRPKSDYDNSVPLYNHSHQRPDFFFFVSLLRDKSAPPANASRFTHAFMVGGMSYEGMQTEGTVWRAGETDQRNGTKFWTDCLNVSMSQLLPVNACLERFADIN